MKLSLQVPINVFCQMCNRIFLRIGLMQPNARAHHNKMMMQCIVRRRRRRQIAPHDGAGGGGGGGRQEIG